MSISRTTIRRLGRLLPQDCELCGLSAGELSLCPACAADLPHLTLMRCPRCALPTPAGAVCGACLASPPHFDRTIAAFRYAFPVEPLIHGLKYRHRLPLAEFLSEALAGAVGLPQVDCLVALPLSRARMRERGFNQAQEIARPLARRFGLALRSDIAQRVRETPPQAGLPWKERQANVRHAFECAVDLSGQTLAVIDDVMTTGATLDEFARTLKLHGAARVENWVVARTLPED